MSLPITRIQTKKLVLPIYLTPEILFDLLKRSMVVDGRPGGLVLGHTHATGNVYMLFTEPGDPPCIQQCAEGGEYILNKASSEKHRQRLAEINTFDRLESLPPIVVTPFFCVLSVFSQPFDKLLWVDHGQAVMNKRATAKHWREINALNLDGNTRLECDLESLSFRPS